MYLSAVLKHCGYVMATMLAVIGIGNNKLLLLFIRKRSNRYTLAVGISFNSPEVNYLWHQRLIDWFVFLRQVFLIFLLLNKHRYMFL